MDKLFDLGPIKAWDFEGSFSPEWIARDIIEKDDCGIGQMSFSPGDVVVDVGANVGIFSIHLARLHPEIKVYGIEPSLANHRHFLMNIEENGTSNVEAVNLALTGDGRRVYVGVHETNTGGADVYSKAAAPHFNECDSMRLEEFLASRGITTVKALKMDVEGAEYEILDGFTDWGKIHYLCGDIHPEPCGLYGRGYSKEKLMASIRAGVPAERRFLVYAGEGKAE